MFGFLKRLMGKSEPQPAAPEAVPQPPLAPPPARPAPTQAPVPAAPPMASRTVMPQTSSRPAPSAPAASPVPFSPPPEAPAPFDTGAFAGQTLDLPLKALWPKLPPALVQTAQSQPGGQDFLKVPLPVVLPMLARGAVKIPLGQFRKFAPAGMFPAMPDKDTLEVELPLSEVVARMKPEQMVRRPQKRVEVPEDIGPVFGAGGANLRVVEAKKPAAPAPAPTAHPKTAPAPTAHPKTAPAPTEAKAPTPAQTPAAAPAKAPAPAAPASPQSPKNLGAGPAPVAPPAPRPAPTPAPAPVEPSVPEPIRAPKLDPSLATLKPGVPKPPPTTPVSAIPRPQPAPAPAAKLPSATPLPGAVPTPKPSQIPLPDPAPKLPGATSSVPSPASVPLPLPTPASASPAAPVAPASAPVAMFELAVAEVAEHWASQGKTDLRALEGSTFHIPVPVIDQALKTGRLRFEWRDVRPWLSMPAGAAHPAFSDDYAVELPLAVVAPKFLKLHGRAKARKKVEVSDEIPDLFAQKSAPQPAPPPAAEPAEPAHSPQPAPSVAAKPMLDYGNIFGQPDKKSWTLAEVTQRAAALRGVAGALIATSDGLLVAGTWPAGVQTEAVAAFIPQMHSRMVQCTKELKLGEPGNFMLTIENVPLQIFKTGGNYLAVLGKAGENLPKPQLTALAMRLSQTQP